MQIDNEGELLYVNFNQDNTCVSIGTKTGYRIYNCMPFGKCFGKAVGGISIVEMLFTTSLVVLVGTGDAPTLSPRRLQIINTKRNTMICELSYASAILNVCLNRRRMAVVLESTIHVYDLSNLKLLNSLETNPNPRGLCALSPDPSLSYLAYPLNEPGKDTGDVFIFDALSNEARTIFPAAQSRVAALAFNSTGTMLATSSETGTIVRVWGMPSCDKLFEFRRGTKAAEVFHLSFDATSTVLSCTSTTGTIHLFKLMQSEASAVSSFLPSVLSSAWDPERSFATIRLGAGGTRSICAVDVEAQEAYVVTEEGGFYQYKFSMTEGGDAELVSEYNLLDDQDDGEEDLPGIGAALPERTDDVAGPSDAGGADSATATDPSAE